MISEGLGESVLCVVKFSVLLIYKPPAMPVSIHKALPFQREAGYVLQLGPVAKTAIRRTKKPMTADAIGVKAGKCINHHKMGKHFILTMEDNRLAFKRNEESIRREADLDGIYIVHTSESSDELSAADTVRTYKSLGQAFRCIKSVDLHVRPIGHRNEAHVRAHVFICMLAYYIEWPMRKALSPVLFQNDQLDEDRWTRAPVAKAEPSQTACAKKRSPKTGDGWPVHSLRTLLEELAIRCKNTCRVGEGKTMMPFEQLTELTPFQEHVFGLLAIKP